MKGVVTNFEKYCLGPYAVAWGRSTVLPAPRGQIRSFLVTTALQNWRETERTKKRVIFFILRKLAGSDRLFLEHIEILTLELAKCASLSAFIGSRCMRRCRGASLNSADCRFKVDSSFITNFLHTISHKRASVVGVFPVVYI